LLIIGIIIYALALILGEDKSYSLILFIISYLIVGYEVIITAAKNILKGQVFDENFLMTIATLGAFVVKEYPEAVAVMIFYNIGEMFESYAVNKSRKSISSLLDLKAEYANLFVNNEEKKVLPEDIKKGDIIIVKPGERVPLDGIIIEGSTSFDTSALTGESIPRNQEENSEVLSGFINLVGVIKIKVTKEYGESTVSRILELVENASSKKAPTEKFITKFARVYTPMVVVAAILLAVIPPLVISNATFSQWLYRACIFLVVSCPCAFVISVPLGLFAGIGSASKKGVLIKGGNYLETLKNIETLVFDKTGTLTKGIFKVQEINPVNIDKNELLKVAAFAEVFSSHPIAQSIVKEYGKEIDKNEISDYQEISGNGVKVKIKESIVLAGNNKLMSSNNIDYDRSEKVGSVVHVAIDNKYKGYILIADEIKEDSKKSLKLLKDNGIKKLVMLTGDNKSAADKVAKELDIDLVYSELLPDQKVEKIEQLINNGEKVAFVGDGINDAPVLARADIGFAMGALGSDAAIEAADVVLMKDKISSIVDAIKVSIKTNRILWQNIIFALVVKIGVLSLSTIGVATMWEGVFADVGVTVIAVINSMRALK
ncbi:MAG: cadmium-translocating P-type ATPase, partial [Clostridium sp.]|nr:cadmium-translocating P-type ATPase [Clostridium sp.]